MKPILFLLKADFTDEKADPLQKYYCPHCAMIEGVLSYYPQLKNMLDIRYVDFPRPRLEIIELVGEENQGCPLLVVPEDYPHASSFSKERNLLFTNDKMKIATFLSDHFDVGLWHP